MEVSKPATTRMNGERIYIEIYINVSREPFGALVYGIWFCFSRTVLINSVREQETPPNDTKIDTSSCSVSLFSLPFLFVRESVKVIGLFNVARFALAFYQTVISQFLIFVIVWGQTRRHLTKLVLVTASENGTIHMLHVASAISKPR